MSNIERYEADGDNLKGRVLLHGRGLPSIFARTNCLRDAELIASALNDHRGAVEALREVTRIGSTPRDSMLSDAEQYRARGQAMMDVAHAALRGR